MNTNLEKYVVLLHELIEDFSLIKALKLIKRLKIKRLHGTGHLMGAAILISHDRLKTTNFCLSEKII